VRKVDYPRFDDLETLEVSDIPGSKWLEIATSTNRSNPYRIPMNKNAIWSMVGKSFFRHFMEWTMESRIKMWEREKEIYEEQAKYTVGLLHQETGSVSDETWENVLKFLETLEEIKPDGYYCGLWAFKNL
jgi:hypothetical protein